MLHRDAENLLSMVGTHRATTASWVIIYRSTHTTRCRAQRTTFQLVSPSRYRGVG